MPKNIDDKVKKAFDDIEDLKYAGVALRAYVKKDIHTTKAALHEDSKAHDKDNYHEGYIDWTLQNEKGIKYATNLYGEKFHEAMEIIPIKDLLERRYDSVIKDNLSKQEDQDVLINALKDFSDKTYGDVMKSYAQAMAKLNDQADLYDKEEKRKAKKTIEEYQGVYKTLQLLEESIYENLRPKVAKEGVKKQFEEHVKDLSEKK